MKVIQDMSQFPSLQHPLGLYSKAFWKPLTGSFEAFGKKKWFPLFIDVLSLFSAKTHTFFAKIKTH